MNKLDKINELKAEIQSLKNAIQHTGDTREQLELETKLYEKKIEINNLILENKQKRAGMSARDLLSKKLKEPIYYETSISAIDNKLKGIPLGSFVQIGASSGAGKTTLILKILSVFSNNMKVVHFDFEMGDYKLARKLHKLLKTDTQKDNYIVDFESYRLDDLIREIEIYSLEGVKFFVIDSRMKIQTNDKDMYLSTAKISSELQRLCRENNITIMLINQMSEESLKAGRPALKGGNDQFYDADIVIFLGKPIVKKGQNGDFDETDSSKRFLIVAKNRFGDEYKAEIFRSEVEPHEVKVNEYQVDMAKI